MHMIFDHHQLAEQSLDFKWKVYITAGDSLKNADNIFIIAIVFALYWYYKETILLNDSYNMNSANVILVWQVMSKVTKPTLAWRIIEHQKSAQQCKCMVLLVQSIQLKF